MAVQPTDWLWEQEATSLGGASWPMPCGRSRTALQVQPPSDRRRRPVRNAAPRCTAIMDGRRDRSSDRAFTTNRRRACGLFGPTRRRRTGAALNERNPRISGSAVRPECRISRISIKAAALCTRRTATLLAYSWSSIGFSLSDQSDRLNEAICSACARHQMGILRQRVADDRQSSPELTSMIPGTLVFYLRTILRLGGFPVLQSRFPSSEYGPQPHVQQVKRERCEAVRMARLTLGNIGPITLQDSARSGNQPIQAR